MAQPSLCWFIWWRSTIFRARIWKRSRGCEAQNEPPAAFEQPARLRGPDRDGRRGRGADHLSCAVARAGREASVLALDHRGVFAAAPAAAVEDSAGAERGYRDNRRDFDPARYSAFGVAPAVIHYDP